MWTCPKCGREFKKTNQDHYCGKAPETVDEYIAMQTPQLCSGSEGAGCMEHAVLYKRKSFHFHGSMQKAYQFLCRRGNN